MQYRAFELSSAVQRVVLSGRLDAAGTEAIEIGFTALVSSSAHHVLLDMREVPFLGSLGIRLILGSARVLQRRDRKLIIFGAPPQPMDVMLTVDLGSLIPIVATEDEAFTLVD